MRAFKRACILHTDIVFFFVAICKPVHVLVFVCTGRLLVCGPPGRSKIPVLFFIGSLLLWLYPLYMIEVLTFLNIAEVSLLQL